MSQEEFQALTSTNFDEFIRDGSGIIICHKPQCPHCKIMKTVLGKLATMEPDLGIAAVDSIAEQELLKKMEVERVPTLCVFKDGNIVARHSGVMNPTETLQWYERAMQ